MKKKKSKWVEVGTIGVDAGLCWVGDPCYILHKKTPPKSLGKDWNGFCDIIGGKDMKSFSYDLGHEGLGVCVSTGYGDGCYPVHALIKDGRVAGIVVDFQIEKMGKLFRKLLK